jgi:hypothetical protein
MSQEGPYHEGGENRLSGIPEAVSTKITLKQNGDTYKATATGNGDQPAEWADLPKYAPDGEAYVYTVVEEAEDIPNDEMSCHHERLHGW